MLPFRSFWLFLKLTGVHHRVWVANECLLLTVSPTCPRFLNLPRLRDLPQSIILFSEEVVFLLRNRCISSPENDSLAPTWKSWFVLFAPKRAGTPSSVDESEDAWL